MGDAVEAMHHELRRVFGDRLRSLLVYGPHADPTHEAPGAGAIRGSSFAGGGRHPIHTLALVDTLSFDDLRACASLAGGWSRRGLATPLLLAADEFARSLDAFPLEYGEIIARHLLIAGVDPFEGLAVKPADLRRACEVQAKSHLLHLREGYLEAGGRPADVAKLIAASARPFAALLTNVARLQGASVAPSAVAAHAEQTLGLPAAVVGRVISLADDRQVGTGDAVDLYAAYLAAVERLAGVLDQWDAK